MKPPHLQGNRVRLEPLVLSHAVELWPVDATTWTYMSRYLRSVEELAAWLDERLDAQREGRAEAWLQRDAGGAAVGVTSMVNLREKRAEIGHTFLKPEARRSGINLEAKLLLLRYAFDTRGLERVQFRTDGANQPSRAAIEALGARFEGMLRRHRQRPDGSWRDTAVYSIIRPEWPSLERALVARLDARHPVGARASGA
jgi:RimJ/RimL family protein N-acetyltransferase